MVTSTILHTYHFKRAVSKVKFSPDGRFFAICKESLGTLKHLFFSLLFNLALLVFVYKAPGLAVGELNPFMLVRCMRGAYDDTTWIDWTSDSR
jgi:periodic tryptophan protein 2